MHLLDLLEEGTRLRRACVLRTSADAIARSQAALWATVKSMTIAEDSKPPASYQFNDKKADHQVRIVCRDIGSIPSLTFLIVLR